MEYQQKGKLSALGLAWCIRVNPKFSFGLTLNIWDNDLTKNKWEQTYVQQTSGSLGGLPVPDKTTRSTDQYEFKGINANIGFLWHINNRFTLGAVLKTPFEADLIYEHYFHSAMKPPSTTVENGKMDMPVSYGFGLSYRHSDRLTGSLDIYRTEWGNFLITSADGKTISPITGESADETDTQPTHQMRMGIEYLFITPKYLVPLRGGIFYDLHQPKEALIIFSVSVSELVLE
ncbi:MAG: hypothetical protein GY795_29445 [Desulfobacterales bacterium]|nr:hypothetical protein [Desulfobacterales bacterium]